MIALSMKNNVVRIVYVLMLCLLIPITGFAQVPKKINYQGYLTNPSGTPIHGTISMSFAIYDLATGGTALWAETQDVDVNNGKYNVLLGTNTPISLAEAKPYYLGVTIGSDPEMTPRQELTSVLYALFVDGMRLDGYTGNTFIGQEAGRNNTSSSAHSNSFIGYHAGRANSSGRQNTFIGINAGSDNATGSFNTFVGAGGGSSNYTGYENTFIGNTAGSANMTGNYNTFIGAQAGGLNYRGHENTFIGTYSGFGHNGGDYNTFLGDHAGFRNITGNGNVFIGNDAGYNETGSNKLFIDNSDTNAPLIYGEFDNRKVQIHGNLTLGYPGEHKAGKIRLWQEGDEADDKVSHAIGTERYYNIYGAGTGYGSSIGHKFYRGGGELIAQIGVGGWRTPTDRLDSYFAGNVGIGTTLSSTGVVAGAGNPEPYTAGRGYSFASPGDPDGGMFSSADDTVQFFTNARERMRIAGPNVGIGTTNPTRTLTVRGNVLIQRASDGANVIELGEGLDYAEGFNVTDSNSIEPGTVLIIDPENPGKLAVSNSPYDTKVAGIATGAKGLGSGVRLGAGQFDYDVALAGRVYCNVNATYGKISPGDLLTTSPTPGYAMVVKDYVKSQGAILGKAMERLEEGQKGQILVLVTLQ